MSVKPEKRLVSKRRYEAMMRGVAARILFGSLLFFAGGIGLLITAGLMLFCVSFRESGDEAVTWWATILNLVALFLGFGGFSTFLLLMGKRTCSEADQIAASIAPITAQNADYLPSQELLRGSSIPPTLQQSELLRATQAKQETPQEQLLRATTGEE